MTAINHTLTGAAIAIGVQQPWLIVPLAVASHFVLDAIPHFGGHPIYETKHRHFWKVMAIDASLCVLALGVAALLAPQYFWLVVLGAFFAVLPDAFWLLYIKMGEPKHWFFDFHQGIQWSETPHGAISEVIYCVLIIVLLVLLAQN